MEMLTVYFKLFQFYQEINNFLGWKKCWHSDMFVCFSLFQKLLHWYRPPDDLRSKTVFKSLPFSFFLNVQPGCSSRWTLSQIIQAKLLRMWLMPWDSQTRYPGHRGTAIHSVYIYNWEMNFKKFSFVFIYTI